MFTFCDILKNTLACIDLSNGPMDKGKYKSQKNKAFYKICCSIPHCDNTRYTDTLAHTETISTGINASGVFQAFSLAHVLLNFQKRKWSLTEQCWSQPAGGNQDFGGASL